MSQPKQQSQAHLFPVLAVDVIVQELSIMYPQLKFTEEDLRGAKLNPERIQMMYTAFLESALDVTPDQLIQPPLDITYQQSYPDIHEEANRLTTLVLAMQRMMFACCVKDFTIQDLIEPKAKRTQVNISALINFCFFQYEHLEAYNRVKKENAAVKEQCEVLARENEECQRQIDHIRSSRAEQEPEIRRLQEDIDERQARINDKQRISADKQRTNNEAKLILSEKKARLAQVQAAIASAKEEGNRLSKQIVQSPERMKGQRERMNQQLSQLRQVRDERRARLLNLHKQKESYQRIEREIDGVNKLVEAIAAPIEKEKVILSEIGNIRDQVGEKREELRELDKTEQQIKRQITSKQEKMAKLSLQHDNMVASRSETRKQLENERNALLESKSAEAQQMAALDVERRQLAEEEWAAAQKHEHGMESMKNKYAELLEQVETYNGKLGESWAKCCSKLENA